MSKHRKPMSLRNLFLLPPTLWITIISELATKCTCWNQQLPSNQLRQSNDICLHRRNFIRSLLLPSTTAAVICFVPNSPPAWARNLPESTGADGSKTGTIESLTDIVSLWYSLTILEKKRYDRNEGGTRFLDGVNIPTEERNFKRLFDAYSDKVSYKQKFKDQNAFLVYYTKGYDGPGRPNIEEEDNEKQTMQYGARNDAWVCWDEVLTELKFIEDDDQDLRKDIVATIRAVDSYLQLAPPEDVEAAKKVVGATW